MRPLFDANRRLPNPGEARFVTRVHFDRQIQIFVRDERAFDIVVRADRPRIDDRTGFAAGREVGQAVRILAAVLVNRQTVGVVTLNPSRHFAVERSAEVAFVPERIGREGDVTAIRPEKFVKVALRVERERLGRNVVIIREFRLQEEPFFVRRFEVFREGRMRVEARVIEPGLLVNRHMLLKTLAVCGLDQVDLVVIVVAATAEEVRFAV